MKDPGSPEDAVDIMKHKEFSRVDHISHKFFFNIFIFEHFTKVNQIRQNRPRE
jgi:hypothetical protein